MSLPSALMSDTPLMYKLLHMPKDKKKYVMLNTKTRVVYVIKPLKKFTYEKKLWLSQSILNCN